MASSSLPSLPSEIWFDHILTRTSLESLGRCRLVSKEWNHITYDSRFWQFLCERSGTANKNLTHSVMDFMPVPVRIEAVSRQGLVFCMSENNYQLFVCKPTTRQWEKLPNPRNRYFTSTTAIVVLSSKPLRYKIIQISRARYPFFKVKSTQYLKWRFEVFDSNTWEWRQLKDVSLPYSICLYGFNRRYISVCGGFYWRLADNKIFAFHYEDDKESWELFDLPQPVRDCEGLSYNRLVEYQGRLGLICIYRESMDQWVMEDHEKKVWRKIRRLSMEGLKEVEGYCPPPVAFYSSDIALVKGHEKLIFYNFRDSSSNVVRLGFDPSEVFKLLSDSERALSLDQMCYLFCRCNFGLIHGKQLHPKTLSLE
ncbi:F-box protein [Pyrus ussuriensis x Pyrus communis]|uniref:F-box protein n=1 Tax=Pyrus ussuriensis x Pyrus communis TaxID=2448454 RepID=A0A5N5GZ24_9ROSA|nr:F-box protein [Pyrus ussuriensis x Pyrus communis]